MNRRTSILYLLSIGFLMSTFLIHNNIIDYVCDKWCVR